MAEAHVGRDVRRHITTLGLDDGQGSERASAELVVHLRGALEETRVKVEDITRVRLTTGGTTEEQRHLTVCDGLLGKIIIDDEGCAVTY